jgi:hypothetical protein
MDPNAALAEIRTLIHEAREATGPHAEAALNEMSEYFEGLDEWLSKGGFLPAAWDGGRR